MEYIKLFNFDRGSSLVNFCESDIYENRIVETYNTYSSLAIVVFGLIGIIKILNDKELTFFFKKHVDIYIEQDLLKKSDNQRLILNYILILVGCGSTYFHSETSEFSHWIDIILISIILLSSEYFIDTIDKKPKKTFYFLFIILHLLSSIYIPSVHIFLQFITGFLIVKKINSLMKKIKKIGDDNYDIMTVYKKIEIEYSKTKIIFGISILLWIIDYFGCYIINPYHTHWLFHIGIGLTSYKIIDLSKYLLLVKSKDVIENRV